MSVSRIFTRTALRIAFIASLSLFTRSAFADDVTPPPPPAAEEEARTHFTAGVNLLRDPGRPRYEDAYTEFKKAYALSSSPKILGNIGLCAMKLERDAEAIAAYSKYLTDVPDLSADERTQVERDLSTLKATLASVTVSSTPAGALIIDTRVPVQGESITNTHGPITSTMQLDVRRGHHIFRARLDGREITWESEIAGGESHVFEFSPNASAAVVAPPAIAPVAQPDTAAAEPSRPIPTTVYIVGGATIALGVTTIITGVVALNKRSSFNDANNGTDPSHAEDLRSSGKTLNVVSDVFLIGTIIGAGVTTYLYLTRPPSAANKAANAFGVFRF